MGEGRGEASFGGRGAGRGARGAGRTLALCAGPCTKLRHAVFAIGVMLGQGIIVKRKAETKRLLASNPDLTGKPLVVWSRAPEVASASLSFSVCEWRWWRPCRAGTRVGRGRLSRAGLWSFSLLSRVCLSAAPWTAARQASLSFAVSRSVLKLTCQVRTLFYLKFCYLEEFPGGPVVWTQRFPSQVQSLGQETKIPWAVWWSQ